MKIRVCLKDPDGFFEAVDDAIRVDVEKLCLPDNEADAIFELRREAAIGALARWVGCNEYVGITFDLDTMTATVDEQRK